MFKDSRYIRINNRPLLMIYRAALIPDAAPRIAAWREMFRGQGEEPIIVMAQSLADHDPRPYGLDGAVEFPPHKISDEVPRINGKLDLFDPEFSAAVFDYEAIAAASLAQPAPQYPLIKTIAPGWDNDPRREGKGLVLHDATPAKYQAWLEGLVKQAGENDFWGEQIVCVNAWNEWAEGAFLEPDIHFGAAFLNATARAICETPSEKKAGLLLVGHDAQPHGAQMLLLNLARHYGRVWGFDVHILLLGAGPLVTDYQREGRVTLSNDKATIANAIAGYAALGIRTALVNSAAAARLVPALAGHGLAVTLLIHEMPRLLAEYNLQVQARLGALAARHVVFSSRFARDSFTESLRISLPQALILPQGNYQNVAFSAEARAAVRRRLGVAASGFLILGAGFGDLRKGFDLFVQIARKLLAAREDVHVLWVGDIQPALKTYLGAAIEAASATGRFHHVGFSPDIAPYFSAADVFALTSREDPYPTVALEALAAGAPVVAFDESGGIPELIRAHKAGAVARADDADDFRRKILVLLNRERLNTGRGRLVALGETFSQPRYAENLICSAQPALHTVSACLVNYNYARYLRPRLASVFEQTYPVREVLFFDDASTDDSVVLAKDIAAAAGRDISVLASAKNAGSAFAQWRRAAETAVGDYVWIAEADDACDPQFLSRIIEGMAAADDAILGFSDSRIIDGAGKMMSPGYQAGDLTAGVWSARKFAGKFLAEQNLIFNVSAVVWRRDALRAALERCGAELADWRIAGDWRLYVELLTSGNGQVVYVAAPLSSHRRHAQSVTETLEPARHLDEIRRMQEIAAGRLGLGAAQRARQAAYLAAVEGRLAPPVAAKTHPAKPAKTRRNIIASGGKV
jgi:glycosyltransferase involved in cell wall biosynthesis